MGQVSGASELSVLSAASGYQSLSKGSTAFPQTDSTWNFFLNSARDLVGVKRAQTGSGTTEVHIACSEAVSHLCRAGAVRARTA